MYCFMLSKYMSLDFSITKVWSILCRHRGDLCGKVSVSSSHSTGSYTKKISNTKPPHDNTHDCNVLKNLINAYIMKIPKDTIKETSFPTRCVFCVYCISNKKQYSLLQIIII